MVVFIELLQNPNGNELTKCSPGKVEYLVIGMTKLVVDEALSINEESIDWVLSAQANVRGDGIEVPVEMSSGL